MRYWLLTTEYPPMFGGGISTYCYILAKKMASMSIEVSVFLADSSVDIYKEEPVEEKLRVIRFNPSYCSLDHSLGYSALLSYSLAAIVEKFILSEGKPDYIECQDYLGVGYYLLQKKHLNYEFIRDVPVVITLHSPAFVYLEYNRVPTYRFPDFWTCEMEKQSICGADLLISPTQFLLEEVQGYMDISCKNKEVIANPFLALDNKPVEVSRNKIVFYGKLSPQKGSFELLSYFEKLWETGFKYPLYIIGGTDIVYHPEMRTMGEILRKKYKRFIDQGLLIFSGNVQPGNIASVLSDAHVIIVPSIVDNLPYVVMEAMGLGKIVLASIQGGQREMIENGVDGFLFSHDNPKSFEKQLETILSLSNEQILEIGNNAQKTVQHKYNPEAVVNRKLEVLGKLDTSKKRNDFPFLYQNLHAYEPNNLTGDNTLTIVIPYFNMGAYIDECVSSVLQSTYQPVEIIIVNDGSTDAHSISKLQNFSDNKRITVVNQENCGLAITRNNGAKLAKGDYLAFLDADDKVSQDYYEKAISILREKRNVFFVGCWVQYFENSNQLWPTFTPQPPYILVHNSVNSSGLVYKKETFIAGGLNDKKVDYGMEDYESVVNMMHHGFNGVVIPETHFFYRVRTGSMFRSVTREKLLYSNKYIAQKHSKYYAAFAAEVLSIVNANGPGYSFDNPTHSQSRWLKKGPLRKVFFKAKVFVNRKPIIKKYILKFIK